MPSALQRLSSQRRRFQARERVEDNGSAGKIIPGGWEQMRYRSCHSRSWTTCLAALPTGKGGAVSAEESWQTARRCNCDLEGAQGLPRPNQRNTYAANLPISSSHRVPGRLSRGKAVVSRKEVDFKKQPVSQVFSGMPARECMAA